MTPLKAVAHGNIVGGVVHGVLQALGTAKKELPNEPAALPDLEGIGAAHRVVDDESFEKALRNGAEDAVDEEAGDGLDPNDRNIQA